MTTPAPITSRNLPLWNIPYPYNLMRWAGVAAFVAGLAKELLNPERLTAGIVLMGLGVITTIFFQARGELEVFKKVHRLNQS